MRKLFNQNQTKTEKYIAKNIVDLGTEFDSLTIEHFSDRVGVSPSMVVKYAKNCGFSGYKEVKYYVKETRSKPESVGGDYIKFQSDKIAHFFEYISDNTELVSELATKIINSQYVVLYGHGPSLGVAKYFANKLSVASKIPVIVQDDEQIMGIEIEKANPRRLVIFLTASLSTEQIIDKLKLVEQNADNYVVIYENDNFEIEFQHGIKLLDRDIKYDYQMFRDRSLYFIYLELVFNQICEKLHKS